MTKITFIGAGSLEFTRELVRDILTFPSMRDAQLCLMDIDRERLEFGEKSVQKIIHLGNYPATVVSTMDRATALKDADYVLCTILVGDTNVWRHDIEIPKKYGIDINVGDTRGPAGIFRALRTIPTMLSIVKDMEKYCPNAVLLNYTNPMAILCGAMQRNSFIRVTGLCHSVQGTAEMLAGWIGAPLNEITYTCAGINHQAWYLEYKWNNQDAYPLIRKAIAERPEIYNEEIVRNEMFLNLDYYVTESSGHNSEYNWWFRKRADLVEKYCTTGTGWNPGEHAYILKEYQHNETVWKDRAREWFAAETPIDLARGQEYAAYIMNALESGDVFHFNGNVPNTALITNLPENCCVEVPVYVDRSGLHPVHVGKLPPQCAAITALNATIEEMAISAALQGNARLVFQAIAFDPLTAAVLSLAEIKSMVRDMFLQNRPYLPQFESIDIE